MPTREEVSTALETQLKKMKAEGPTPDVLTFAGNGEPTLHPHFAEIINDTIALRNNYFPQAKISVLTNATQIIHKSVFDALCLVDNNICKLDTISPEYITLIDRPNKRYNVDEIINTLIQFEGKCIIQTMFMNGNYNGQSVSNTTSDFVSQWLQTIAKIQPREVMIYTIDRETPTKGLSKASPAELDSIAFQVRALGLECKVAY